VAERTLIFVAGASPQIITETAYALLDENPPETRIHVLTTRKGRDAISDALLGRGKWWSKFRAEYPKARAFRLDGDSIRLLHDANGDPLDDVRTPEDNKACADQIVDFVKNQTRHGFPPVHASIAGGRKTMGYLLAAAMMLYGRREDRLSHVLVHPPELEGTDFYFPPPRPTNVLTYRRPDGRRVKVKSEDLQVQLAELPFLRLRGVRDPAMLRGASFSRLVNELQADLDALSAPRLAFLPDGGGLVCSGRQVRLSPAQSALYELLARRRRRGCGQADCPGCALCFVPAHEVPGSFRHDLRRILTGRGSHAVGRSTPTTSSRLA
jgi:CRISPR-associated protein (TIGR02584 family)